MKFYSLLIFCFPLAATVNEPLRVEFFSGYRNDRIHWHLQQGGEGTLLYSEIYRDVEFWENGLTMKAIHRDLSFFLKGGYSTFGRGAIFQRYANQSFATDQPKFQGSSNGWAADGSGYFGYAANLTADRTYKFIATPLIGYSAHFEQLKRGGISPSPFESNEAIEASSYTMSSQLPRALHLTWYGFLFGIGINIQPGNRVIFDAGYSYHLLNVNFKTQVENQISLFNPDLISDEKTYFSVHPKTGGNHGHTGWAQLDFLLSRAWRFGLGAQIHYFVTNVLETDRNQEVTNLLSSDPSTSSEIDQKFKLRWTSVSGWIEASREF